MWIFSRYQKRMNTPRRKKVVTLTLDPHVWERLEEWIAAQTIRHPKNSVVDVALTRFLDEEEEGKAKPAVQIDKSKAKGA